MAIDLEQPREPSRTWIDVLMRIACALLVGVALWWIAELWARGGGHWLKGVTLSAWIVGVACLVALRHERHWSAPTHRLIRTLPLVRDGKAAIESLSAIKGGIRDVLPVVQGLLHEIRRKELALAELNEEMRRRMANRTDALERKLDSLREQAARDPLTGLYNRRSLDAILTRLLDEARLAHADLGVLMLDVDDLKLLNDALGHAAGDALLRDLGRIIRSTIGDDDVAIRYGGDEFLVLLPGSDGADSQALALRLVSLVDALAKTLRVARTPRLSIGIAQLSDLGHASPHELVQAADRNLYCTKAARKTEKAH